MNTESEISAYIPNQIEERKFALSFSFFPLKLGCRFSIRSFMGFHNAGMNLLRKYLLQSLTAGPRSSDPFFIVSYYITTSWTYSIISSKSANIFWLIDNAFRRYNARPEDPEPGNFCYDPDSFIFSHYFPKNESKKSNSLNMIKKFKLSYTYIYCVSKKS